MTDGCPAHGDREALYGPDFAKDPRRVYARLREFGPMAPVDLAPGVPATLVTSYDAALDVLRDPVTFQKDARGWQRTVPDDCPVLPIMMYRPNCRNSDGAEHARLRQVVTDSLARIDMNALRAGVERSADTLINRFAPTGRADLIADYARALPQLVFNQMFDCPAELGDRLVEGMSGIFDTVNAKKANAVLRQAVLDLVTLKRKQPGDDVASWLISHPAKLTVEEVMHQILTLQGAGTEPEQNLIANCLRLLLSDSRFAGDLSGGSLPVEDAIDEVLWTDPPLANFGITYPVEDVDFAGTRLPKDQPVVISLTAANNDPSLTARHREGNRAHLAWSAGPHTCPAQRQARLIASAAIEKLLDAIPEMTLAVPADELEWRPGPFHRALVSLPVRFPPVTVGPRPGFTGLRTVEPPAAPVTEAPEPEAPVKRRRWGGLARWWRGE